MRRPASFEYSRGLSRVQAAAYIGISPTTFDKLVKLGDMPQPKRVGARKIYDRFELDVAFDLIGKEGDDDVDELNDFDIEGD